MLYVPFTGGTQTEYGVTPAKYSTANAVVQAIIERSEYFRKGRIVLLSTKKAASDKADEPAGKADGAGRTATAKAFPTLADAKEWIADSYGVPPQGIRTIADAVKAAAGHGVALSVGKENGD